MRISGTEPSKHNNKGIASRKGECSTVRINRLQQFCTATDCKPSLNTTFTTLHSPLLHPIHISKASSVSRDEQTSHDPFLGAARACRYTSEGNAAGCDTHVNKVLCRTCTPSHFCFLIVLDRKIVCVDTDFFSCQYEESKWEN